MERQATRGALLSGGARNIVVSGLINQTRPIEKPWKIAPYHLAFGREFPCQRLPV
jgi:hypothetical protein